MRNGVACFWATSFRKNASSSREIDAAFVNLLQKRADALMVSPDPLFDSRRVPHLGLTCLDRWRELDRWRGKRVLALPQENQSDGPR